eukprot:370601-Rhodomonas_salina.2
MDKTVARRFMTRQEEKGLVTELEAKVATAWRLACMEPAEEETIAEVFKEMASLKNKSMENNELSIRYLRASVFSCYGYYTEALKEEIKEKEAMGDYGNLTLRCIGIASHLPKSIKGGQSASGEKDLAVYNKDWTWKTEKLHKLNERKEELKLFVVKHFTVAGRKPTVVTAGVFTCAPEPPTDPNNHTKPLPGQPMPLHYKLLSGRMQTRPNTQFKEATLGLSVPIAMKGSTKLPEN